jgi:predicted SAM-dependent methyltransferase
MSGQTVSGGLARLGRQTLGRLAGRLRNVPVIGKVGRYLKRAIFLPWNFHKLFVAFHETIVHQNRAVESVASEARAGVRAGVDRLEAVGHELVTRFHESADLHARQVEAGMQRLREQHAACYDRLAEQVRAQAEALQALTERLDGSARWLEMLTANQHGQTAWLESMAKGQHGTSDWINVLARKVEMMALDLRERVTLRPDRPVPEPVIVDAEGYRAKVAAMAEGVRVNLGCGEKPLPGYVNVDARELREVDVVADVTRLPFESGTLAEVASAHLVEHFRQHHLATVLLPYWKSLLKSGGVLRVVCPNWAAMIRRLNAGEMSLAEFKLVTFGGQDYPGDDHFAMYTPETLTGVLREVGFSEVTVLVEERMNGLCPEMELLARM